MVLAKAFIYALNTLPVLHLSGYTANIVIIESSPDHIGAHEQRLLSIIQTGYLGVEQTRMKIHPGSALSSSDSITQSLKVVFSTSGDVRGITGRSCPAYTVECGAIRNFSSSSKVQHFSQGHSLKTIYFKVEPSLAEK